MRKSRKKGREAVNGIPNRMGRGYNGEATGSFFSFSFSFSFFLPFGLSLELWTRKHGLIRFSMFLHPVSYLSMHWLRRWAVSENACSKLLKDYFEPNQE